MPLETIFRHGHRFTVFVPDNPPTKLPDLSKVKEERDPHYDKLNTQRRERRFAKQLAEFRDRTK